jgi:hypothetical protein
MVDGLHARVGDATDAGEAAVTPGADGLHHELKK